MQSKKIITIIALSVLGICLVLSLANVTMKKPFHKTTIYKTCHILFFVAVVLLVVSQLLRKIDEFTAKASFDREELGDNLYAISDPSNLVGTCVINDTTCKYQLVNSTNPFVIVKANSQPKLSKGQVLFFNTCNCKGVNNATDEECNLYVNKQITIGETTGIVTKDNNNFKIMFDSSTIPPNFYICSGMEIFSQTGTAKTYKSNVSVPKPSQGFKIGVATFPLLTEYSAFVSIPQNDQTYDLQQGGIGRSYITIKSSSPFSIPEKSDLFFRTCTCPDSGTCDHPTIKIGTVKSYMGGKTSYPWISPIIPKVKDNIFIVMLDNDSFSASFYLPTQNSKANSNAGPISVYSTVKQESLKVKSSPCDLTLYPTEIVSNITKLPDQNIASDTLKFIVIGDWGYNQTKNCCAGAGQSVQAGLAKSMVTQTEAKFVCSLGDNFYLGGISGVSDYQWQQTYEKVYTPKIPWYPVVGNHDVYSSGCGLNQIKYYQSPPSNSSKMWILPNYYYSKKFNCTGFSLEIFMIDTNVLSMVDGGDCNPANEQGGWAYHPILQCSGTDSKDQDKISQCRRKFECIWQSQVTWLEKALSSSNAKYKIVMSHIPPGGDCVGATLFGSRFAPLQKMFNSYGVKYFFGGHFHSTSCGYNSDAKLNVVLTGAGGGSGGGGGNAPCVNDWGDIKYLWGMGSNGPGGKGSGPSSGEFAYTLVTVTASDFEVAFYDQSGKKLWSGSLIS